MDPEALDLTDTENCLKFAFEEAENLIGRAERAMAEGNLQAAIDLAHEAGEMLRGADWS